MNQADKYYEHSGAIGLMGPIYMIILGAVGTLILGVIYGYAIHYIPFIYLNFFITLGFGGIVGFLVGIGGKIGKVRNTKVLLFFGLIFGILAEYAGWISWIYAFTKQGMLALMPSQILSIVQVVSATGAWSIFGWTPTGTALYIIWGIEGLLIIGTSVLMAWAVLSDTPFCEHCSQWVEEKDTVSPLEPIDNPEALKSQLEQGNFAGLKSLQKKESETDGYSQVELLHCSSCQRSNFLTVKSITVSIDSKNKEEKEEKTILENLIISIEHFNRLKKQW